MPRIRRTGIPPQFKKFFASSGFLMHIAGVNG
jgi:hypothetical protein